MQKRLQEDRSIVASVTENKRRQGSYPLTSLVHPRTAKSMPTSSASAPVNQHNSQAPRLSANSGGNSTVRRTITINDVSATASGRSSSSHTTAVSASAETHPNSEQPSVIDPEKVAEKVYRLMQRDLLLDRERAGRRGR